MDNIKVKVNKSLSSYDLNGERMKLKLVIDCNKEYRTYRGQEMAAEIFKAIEDIMENYAIVHNNVNQHT